MTAINLISRREELSGEEPTGQIRNNELGYLLITMVGFITHGSLILNDGIYWDDWLLVTLLRGKDWETIWDINSQRGMPLDSFYMYFFSYFSDVVFPYKVSGFILILLTAVLIYSICSKTGLLNRTESLWISLLSLCYPAYQTWILLCTSNYILYYATFLTGILTAIISKGKIGSLSFLLRLGSLLLFFLSFSYNSLLVFYVGYLLLFGFKWIKRPIRFRGIIQFYILRHPDYVCLPFAFWIVKETFFPRHGLYANYNKFNLSVPVITTKTEQFINNGILGPIQNALMDFARQPILWLLTLGLVAVFLGLLRFRRSFTDGKTNHPVLMISTGIFLFVLAILPYVVVGLGPRFPHGWDSRHNLLLGLPVGIVLTAILSGFQRMKIGKISHLGWGLLGILVVAFSTSTVTTYIDWQARSAKDHAILHNLARMKDGRGYSVYWVDDRFDVSGDLYYAFYEWSSMFKLVWGGETRLGLDKQVVPETWLTEYAPKYRHRFYYLSEFNPYGCQATLTIQPGMEEQSHWEIATRYLYYRLINPEQKLAYLNSLVSLEIKPYVSPLAKDCMLTALGK